MKLVKKFLRVLPIIVLLYLFIGTILCYKENVQILLDSGDYSNIDIMTAFSDNLNECFAAIGYDFFDMFGIQSSFDNVLHSWNIRFSPLCFPNLVISILLYELFLSLLYLIFDVFNWFLSLGRNLLKKGGKYDD